MANRFLATIALTVTLALVFIPTKSFAQYNIYSAQASAYFNRGLDLHNLKRYKDAIDLYSKSIQLDSSNWDAFCNRGLCIWRTNGDLNAALSDMSNAIRLNPNSSIAYNNRGIIWHDLKKFDETIKDTTKAISLEPGLASAYSVRGNAWSAKKKNTTGPFRTIQVPFASSQTTCDSMYIAESVG